MEQVSEVRHRQGKTEKGKDYAFYQQTLTLAVEGKMLEINQTADEEPKAPMFSFGLDDYVKIKVMNPREFKGRVSFDFFRL